MPITRPEETSVFFASKLVSYHRVCQWMYKQMSKPIHSLHSFGRGNEPYASEKLLILVQFSLQLA